MARSATRFIHKVVIITGAAGGLGTATARKFADEGARLVLVDWSADGLTALVDEFVGQGVPVIGMQGDVSKADTVRRTVSAALDTFGRIDVLFNNAAIDPMPARSLVETTEEQWDSIMSVNLKSMYLFVHDVIPVMERQGGGAIVNTASSAGIKASSAEAAYGISKAGVIALTRSLARDFSSGNIRANAIAPGFLEAMPSDRREGASAEVIAARSAKAGSLVPLGREGTYDEIANAVLFLACEESSYTSGAALLMDGGWTA
jgi:NAD(P)-dependent dehydrogenase (short-subunit alcohol dehydrogenase family)